jgi:hypothetical protein
MLITACFSVIRVMVCGVLSLLHVSKTSRFCAASKLHFFLACVCFHSLPHLSFFFDSESEADAEESDADRNGAEDDTEAAHSEAEQKQQQQKVLRAQYRAARRQRRTALRAAREQRLTASIIKNNSGDGAGGGGGAVIGVSAAAGRLPPDLRALARLALPQFTLHLHRPAVWIPNRK